MYALRCGLAALRSYAALHTARTMTCPVPGVSCPKLAALAPALSEALSWRHSLLTKPYGVRPHTKRSKIGDLAPVHVGTWYAFTAM